MPTPYDVEAVPGGYVFTTVHNVEYFYYFEPATGEQFEDIPGLVDHVFSFGFLPSNEGGFSSLPTDERVAATVVQAIAGKFEDSRNIVVFVVEHEDKRHPARVRKFNNWYERYGRLEIQLYPGIITADAAVIYSAMLIHEANPFKEAALQRYHELLDSLSK